jgi:hypothetical protein
MLGAGYYTQKIHRPQSKRTGFRQSSLGLNLDC